MTILIYTTIGGYRAVALTDALQGIIMTIGTVVLIVGAIVASGGVSNIIGKLYEIDPGLISPYGPDPSFYNDAMGYFFLDLCRVCCCRAASSCDSSNEL